MVKPVADEQPETAPEPRIGAPLGPQVETLSIEQLLEQKQPTVVPVSLRVNDSTVVVFKFATIGRRAWEKLIDEHAATDEQQTAHLAEQEQAGIPTFARSFLRWNPDTFRPVAIAAACIEPAMTLEQAQQMWDDPRFAPTELQRLFNGATAANEPAADQVTLGKGSAATSGSAPS